MCCYEITCGGVRGRVKGHVLLRNTPPHLPCQLMQSCTQVIFVGIIDTLVPFSLRKRAEYWLKVKKSERGWRDTCLSCARDLFVMCSRRRCSEASLFQTVVNSLAPPRSR
jgi:hypothetical protein